MFLKKFYKILLISLIISLGTACSTTSKTEYITKHKMVKPDIPIAARPSKLQLNYLRFYVVTEKNYEEFKINFLKENSKLTYIVISVDDYENLAINISEIRKYITQQKNIILYYEKAIKEKLTDKQDKSITNQTKKDK